MRASNGAVLATLTGNGLNGPTVAAFDGIVKDWHHTGFLIDEGNKWHMPPSQRLLELHRQYAANKEN